MLDKALGRIKKVIVIKKNDNYNILIDTNDELPDNITLKNVMIFMTCVIKDGAIIQNCFYKKNRFLNKHGNNMLRKDYVKKYFSLKNN